MIKLSKEQVLMLHTQLIRQSGGSDGIRDVNLLESALDTLSVFWRRRTLSNDSGKSSEAGIWIN